MSSDEKTVELIGERERSVYQYLEFNNFLARIRPRSEKSMRPALGKKGELVTAQRVSPVLKPRHRRKVI